MPSGHLEHRLRPGGLRHIRASAQYALQVFRIIELKQTLISFAGHQCEQNENHCNEGLVGFSKQAAIRARTISAEMEIHIRALVNTGTKSASR